jgi:hypothetical protein
MGNELVKLENAEDFREAIGVLARGHTELEAVVKQQGELLRGMDSRIRTLTALIDNHQRVFEKQGWALPQMGSDPLAN